MLAGVFSPALRGLASPDLTGPVPGALAALGADVPALNRMLYLEIKFFLTDQSTNGTYVTFTGEPEIVLRREEVMLRRTGRISFGHSGADAGGDSVEFAIKS